MNGVAVPDPEEGLAVVQEVLEALLSAGEDVGHRSRDPRPVLQDDLDEVEATADSIATAIEDADLPVLHRLGQDVKVQLTSASGDSAVLTAMQDLAEFLKSAARR